MRSAPVEHRRPSVAAMVLGIFHGTLTKERPVLDALTAAVFRSLSRLRGRRVVHPAGVAFEAEWRATGAEPVLVDPDGGRRAVVRLSRGLGLPTPLPDVLGVAIKVIDAHGPGRDQDLLLASAGHGRVWRRLAVLRRSFAAGPFSSLLPYELPGRHGPITATVRGVGEATFASLRDAADVALTVEVFAGGDPVAEVRLGRRLADAVARDLRFDPWHSGTSVRPVGWLNRLRRPAYSASQQGRGAPDDGARDRIHPR